MLYEKGRELAQLTFQRWASEEVFSFGWFVMLGVLLVTYVVWLILVDRRRGIELLLLGSLEAVAKVMLTIILSNALGLYEYTIRLLPLIPNMFATSVTISPIIVMLVQQYTSSWKGYIIWSAIGFAFLDFVVFPVYMLVGALQFYNWNVFYHFLLLFVVSLGVRAVFLWITGSQKRLTRNVKIE